MTNKTLKRTKTLEKSSQKPVNIVVTLLCWAIPMAWVGAIPKDGARGDSSTKIEASVVSGESLVKKFKKKYGTVPQNLNELRAFGITEKSEFHPWDSYGQRLDYLRLGKSSWYLRSFGKDGQQNTLMTTQDPVVSSIRRDLGEGVTHDFTRTSIRYNPAILMGAVSSQGNWHAKLYLDHMSGASRLLVRHKIRKSYFMITEHNTVEEFYWLPDGYRIVFSATGSNRYKDGIYLWNLLSDQVTNLYPGSNNLGTADQADRTKFWLFSLAGVMENPTRALVFAKPKTNTPLNLAEFFKSENLISISIPENGKSETVKISADNKNTSLFSYPLSQNWEPSSDISNCEAADKSQQNWCKLPLEGAFQDVLSSWQGFAEKSSGGPIFSYALLQLSALYSDSYQLLLDRAETDPEDLEVAKNAEILRSYGSEITRALSNLPVAPGWMRAAAWFNLEQLDSQKPLPFQMSKVVINE